MNSILPENIREDFFIRLYFKNLEEFHLAGVKRAFLDFSRTLKVVDSNRENLKKSAEKYILSQLTEVTKTEFLNQSEFDKFHKLSCEQLIQVWNELTFGQAQKWINMTLKYSLLLGDKRINGIEKNAKFFHIPIDSYVQKGMFGEKLPKAWSKINSYETYMKYQLIQRNKQTGNFPIIDEFLFFNNYKPNTN